MCLDFGKPNFHGVTLERERALRHPPYHRRRRAFAAGSVVEHPLLRAARAVLGWHHDACRALARAVVSDSPFDWNAAKLCLSELPDGQWEEIKDLLRAAAAIPPVGGLN